MLSLFLFLDFFSFMCILEVWTLNSVIWDEEDISTIGKEDGSSVDNGAEQDRLGAATRVIL